MVTTRFLSALSMRSWLYIAVIGVASTQYVPDSQRLTMDELERLLVDTGGINDGVFKSGITPCSNYVDSSTGLNNNTLGRQTASQWIRTAFRKGYGSIFPFRFPMMIFIFHPVGLPNIFTFSQFLAGAAIIGRARSLFLILKFRILSFDGHKE